MAKEELNAENLEALAAGMVNLERHVKNIRDNYGVTPIVSINQFVSDTDAELALLVERVEAMGVRIAVASHWANGGAGATELAHMVAEACDADDRAANSGHDTFVYPDTASLLSKIEAVATKVYGASEVTANSKVRNRLHELEREGYGAMPVCIAKTPYSFSTDAQLKGAPSGHVMDIREVRLSVGAGFVVVVCGDVMTMPGLPKIPASENIDVVDGQVTGLF